MSRRHCEPTGRANARPMTGSAKQSILPLRGKMDCFAALAMTSHRLYGSLAKRPFSPATIWVVNLHGEQLLTFGDTIAISTSPGTASGLLPLDGICE